MSTVFMFRFSDLGKYVLDIRYAFNRDTMPGSQLEKAVVLLKKAGNPKKRRRLVKIRKHGGCFRSNQRRRNETVGLYPCIAPS